MICSSGLHYVCWELCQLDPASILRSFTLPSLWVLFFSIALGLSWFLSALGVFIRDIGQISSFLGTSTFYSSGVFYSAEKAEASAPVIWQFLQWNPLLQIIDAMRQVILLGRQLNWFSVAHTWIFGLVVLLIGRGFSIGSDPLLQMFFKFPYKILCSSLPAMFCSPFFTICP